MTRLAPCPNTPNCVSSAASPDDRDHYVEPLPNPLGTSAIEQLESLVRSMPRTSIATVEENYLRAEFRSLVFRFVDDVEFEVRKNVIHIRSASRIGRSDLGANRRRVEKIRRAWNEITTRLQS